MTMTTAESPTVLSPGPIIDAAKTRQRRAAELRLLADDFGVALEPLRVATMRRAAELELSGAALCEMAVGLGADHRPNRQ